MLFRSGKLAPRYVGPFPIIAKRGELSYQLELPAVFPKAHDVFHVSQLRRCFKHPIRGVDHPSSRICLTVSILFVFLVNLKGRPEGRLPSSSKSNGLIIPKLKQPGNKKIVYDLSTLPFSLLFRISGRDSCKGGRPVTSHFCNKDN